MSAGFVDIGSGQLRCGRVVFGPARIPPQCPASCIMSAVDGDEAQVEAFGGDDRRLFVRHNDRRFYIDASDIHETSGVQKAGDVGALRFITWRDPDEADEDEDEDRAEDDLVDIYDAMAEGIYPGTDDVEDDYSEDSFP